MRRLNVFVTELLELSSVPEEELTIENPREGWVFIAGEPKRGAAIRVNGEQVRCRRRQGWLEAMRYLPKGLFTVTGDGAMSRLVVRAIPELAYSLFRYDPLVPEFGPYDWSFLEANVLAHVNTIIGGRGEQNILFAQRWHARGGKWLVQMPLPGLNGDEVTADEVHAVWSEDLALKHPAFDGIIVDEFPSDDRPAYPVWTEAAQRLRHEVPQKFYYPYTGFLPESEAASHFGKAMLEDRNPIVYEVYLPEPDTIEEAEELLEQRLRSRVRDWEKWHKGSARSLMLALGYMTINESLNINPSVDFKVWMDMQFHHIVNHKEFEGLFGLLEYTSGYTDEETQRWASALYRHYAIEGNTTLLSDAHGYTFALDHIVNPDFADGLAGWTVETADGGEIDTREMEGFSFLQGRYPRTSRGDTFLWTKRSDEAPNRLLQTIRNLVPGKTYSVKMIAADYRHITRGHSEHKRTSSDVCVEGGEPLPRKSFVSVVPNNYAHSLGPFDREHKAWFTYHHVVFRALEDEARLIISDWSDSKNTETEGELMANFVEVQPWFEDGS